MTAYVLWLVVALLVLLALNWWIETAHIVTWRRCLRCGWWFSSDGKSRTRPPENFLRVEVDGVCRDCGKDLDYGRE